MLPCCLLLQSCAAPIVRDVEIYPINNKTEACKAKKDQIILENNSGCIVRTKPNA